MRDLSTDDSPAFVNGVLGTMMREQGPDRRLIRAPPSGWTTASHGVR